MQIILSASEKEMIKDVLLDLQKTDIYFISNIKNTLKECKNHQNSNIRKWYSAIIEAATQFNNEKYNELIKL